MERDPVSGAETAVPTLYYVTRKYVMRRIAEESILVPTSPHLKSRDCLFVLNPTAHVVYVGIESRHSVERIERELLDGFEGATADEVRADVASVLGQMIEIEAVHVAVSD